MTWGGAIFIACLIALPVLWVMKGMGCFWPTDWTDGKRCPKCRYIGSYSTMLFVCPNCGAPIYGQCSTVGYRWNRGEIEVYGEGKQ
jgi:predicted RNA-binding Zn-ribbon protein involved in translation (DUF1610 family)